MLKNVSETRNWTYRGCWSRANCIVETACLCKINSSLLGYTLWSIQQNVNNKASNSRLTSCTCASWHHCILFDWSLRWKSISSILCLFLNFFCFAQKCLSFSRLFLKSSEFISSVTLGNSKSWHKALYPFDVSNVKVNFLLQNDQIFIHLNF